MCQRLFKRFDTDSKTVLEIDAMGVYMGRVNVLLNHADMWTVDFCTTNNKNRIGDEKP